MKKYIKSVDYKKYIDESFKDKEVYINDNDELAKAIYNSDKWFFSTYIMELECRGDIESRSPRDFIEIKFLPKFLSGESPSNDDYVKFRVRCPTTIKKCGKELEEYILDIYYSKYMQELEDTYSFSEKKLTLMDEVAFLEKKIKSMVNCRGTYYSYGSISGGDQPKFQVFRNDYSQNIISIYDISKEECDKVLDYINNIYSSFISQDIETKYDEEKHGFHSSPRRIAIILPRGDNKVLVDGRMHLVKYIPDDLYARHNFYIDD